MCDHVYRRITVAQRPGSRTRNGGRALRVVGLGARSLTGTATPTDLEACVDGSGVVDMSTDRNAPPKAGWAKIVTELHVTDLGASIAFWRDILGFEIAYRRKEEKFVYLEHPEGQQIMLCQRHGRFETGPMQPPLGQGAMFQIYFEEIDPILSNLAARNWPIYLGPRDVWRKTGDRESGQREVLVQDPDGYLLMLAQSMGERM
jgi:catechol 2,3-dioxygenase-like lactoylglutathione lyase family enzyme